MRDEIVLTLPPEPVYYDVAHLVLGGLAARMNLTIERLEDLQTALEGALPAAGAGTELTVTLRVDGDAVTASVGPFDPAALEAELESGRGGVGLRRVLDTVADEWGVDRGDAGSFVSFTKREGS